MSSAQVNIPAGLTVPYLDQWLGMWFVEPERGAALFGAIRQLNIGVHLQQRMADPGERCDGCGLPYQGRAQHGPLCGNCKAKQTADPQHAAATPPASPTAADFTSSPRTRNAYGYRVFDGVALLELNGTLMKHEASATESTSTIMMRRTVRALAVDPAVKAVIFMIDSPGGTVAGAYELAADIRALTATKPVHAHCSNLAASAAYLMASQMTSISAAPSTLVGSLGTFGVVYDMSAMAAMEGVKVHLLKGKVNGKPALMKGAGTPGTEISPEQLARMQEGVDDMNAQFIEAVLAGPRKPKAAAVEAWFLDAGVWLAPKARTMGLIDRVESFDEMFSRVAGKNESGRQTGVPSESPQPAEDTTSTRRRSETEQTAGAEASPPTAGAINESEAEAASRDVPAAEGADATQTGDTSPEKGADMSQTATPAPGNPATEQKTEPKAATMAELKAACPGASSDFLVECSEKGMTVVQAKDAFIGWQAAQIRSREEELTKAKQTTTAAPAAGATSTPVRKPGVPAVASEAAERSTAGAAGGDAIEAFNSAVGEQMAKPGFGDRKKAIAAVMRSKPQVHQAYLEATNSGRKQREAIADRFGS